MRGLWVSMFDVFWVAVFSGGFLASGFPCVCVCVCVFVCVRARGLAHLVYLQVSMRNDDEISASPLNIGIYMILSTRL